jgi:hypothetical protein
MELLNLPSTDGANIGIYQKSASLSIYVQSNHLNNGIIQPFQYSSVSTPLNFSVPLVILFVYNSAVYSNRFLREQYSRL